MFEMMRLVNILLIFFAATSAVIAAKQPPPRTDRVAIVFIPAWSDRPTVTTRLFREDLVQSLYNHLSYYLRLRGDNFDISRASEQVKAEMVLAALEPGAYSSAVCVFVYGRVKQAQGIVTDRHRRRRFSTFEKCLEIDLECVRFSHRGAEWRTATRRTISTSARPQVEAFPGITNRDSKCEAFEHVVRRAVTQLADLLPTTVRPGGSAETILPLKFYLSGSVAEADLDLTDLERTVKVASELLEAEFGVGVRLATIDTLQAVAGRNMSLRRAFASLKRLVPLYPDTLSVLVNRVLAPEEYFGEGWREEVGLTQLGRKRTAIDLLPAASVNDTSWFAISNALVLVHELGHSFGAIHVSDINSVMTPRATWVAGARMDPVNKQLVEAALKRELTFSDPAAYLRFVSRTIASTPYQLTDYPMFLAQFLDHSKSLSTRRRMRDAIGQEAILNAIDGYTALEAGRQDRAAALFRRALEANPHQASLYYYLARALDGPEANALMQTAADMGFLYARDHLTGKDSVDKAR